MPRSDGPGRIPLSNQILAALPPTEYDRLRSCCELVALPLKSILYGPGQAIPYVYFPISGVISFLAVMESGAAIEVGLVGREGVVGLSVLLEAETAYTRCIVQVSGQALRMPVEVFRAQVRQLRPLHGLLLRFTYAFLNQVSQSLACTSLHPVHQRCCRWLLQTHDRVQADQFPMTHEFLANMLGVRRPTVTEVAGMLQQQGLIRYGRGKMTILDRARLQAAACECYRAIQTSYGRLP